MKNLNKFRRLIIVLCAAVFVTSCSSVAKYSTAKTIDIKPTVIQKPTVADLQVNEKKATGTHSGKIKTTSLETIQNEAVASALKSASADILVEPRFDTTIDGSITTVVVSGFPATYKNFRTMKDEDISLMKIGAVKQLNTFIPPTVTAKKPKVGKIVLITLGITTALIAVLSADQ